MADLTSWSTLAQAGRASPVRRVRHSGKRWRRLAEYDWRESVRDRMCAIFLLPVPELTSAANIKLNTRVSLQPIHTCLAWLPVTQIGRPQVWPAYCAIRGRFKMPSRRPRPRQRPRARFSTMTTLENLRTRKLQLEKHLKESLSAEQREWINWIGP